MDFDVLFQVVLGLKVERMQSGMRKSAVRASPGINKSSGGKQSVRKEAAQRAERKDEVVEEEALPEVEVTPLSTSTPLATGAEAKVKLTMQLIRLRGLTAEERKADADTM